MVSFPLERYPVVALLDHMEALFLIFCLHTVFHNDSTNLHSLKTVGERGNRIFFRLRNVREIHERIDLITYKSFKN
jgi:hypothetical protein